MKNRTDNTPHGITSLLTTWFKRHQFASRLHALDDRLLEDIGVQRFQINDVAEQTYPKVRLKTHLLVIVRAVRNYLQHRQAIRQLSSLDDRMLADIGLRRSDIPGMLRRELPYRAFSEPTVPSVSNAELPVFASEIESTPVQTAANDDSQSIAA